QFPHNILTEWGQTVMRRLIGGRIRPVVIEEVCEREIPDTESCVHTKDPEIVIDHMTAFDPHQSSDLVVGSGPAYVSGRRCQHQVVRMRANRFADMID